MYKHQNTINTEIENVLFFRINGTINRGYRQLRRIEIKELIRPSVPAYPLTTATRTTRSPAWSRQTREKGTTRIVLVIALSVVIGTFPGHKVRRRWQSLPCNRQATPYPTVQGHGRPSSEPGRSDRRSDVDRKSLAR